MAFLYPMPACPISSYPFAKFVADVATFVERFKAVSANSPFIERFASFKKPMDRVIALSKAENSFIELLPSKTNGAVTYSPIFKPKEYILLDR